MRPRFPKHSGNPLREWLWRRESLRAVIDLLFAMALLIASRRISGHPAPVWRVIQLFLRIAAIYFIVAPISYFVLPPLLLLAMWLQISWIRRQPTEAEFPCPVCGYDIRATPSRCPECGTELMWGQLPDGRPAARSSPGGQEPPARSGDE